MFLFVITLLLEHIKMNYINPFCMNFVFHWFLRCIIRRTGSYRLPIHRCDAHRIFFHDLLLFLNRHVCQMLLLEVQQRVIAVKGTVSVLTPKFLKIVLLLKMILKNQLEFTTNKIKIDPLKQALEPFKGSERGWAGSQVCLMTSQFRPIRNLFALL